MCESYTRRGRRPRRPAVGFALRTPAPVGDGVLDVPLSDMQPANGNAPVGDGVLDVPPPPGTHTG